MHVNVELYLEKHTVVIDVKDANLLDLAPPVDDEACNATDVHVSEFERVHDSRSGDTAVGVEPRVCKCQHCGRLFNPIDLRLNAQIFWLLVSIRRVQRFLH